MASTAAIPNGLTPSVPARVTLPAKSLGWSSDDPSQAMLPLSATLPAADGSGTPSVARSRSGSNLLSPPGLVAPPGTPSHGSTLHGTGNCRPCAWFWKPNGCQNGQDCGHCHLCPEGEIKARKKNKVAVMRLDLTTPTASCTAAGGLDTGSPLTFGFGLMGATGTPYAAYPTPWLCPDMAFTPFSEPETTTASGSEQGSLISSGSRFEQLTASPSTEQESAPNDSRSASEKDDQEGTLLPLGPPPGLKAPPNTPSHGSVSHSLGNCRPCAWFHKPSGCQNSQECNYCHICSDGELKSRKKNKQAAMRLGLVTSKGDIAAESDARYALSLASCV